MKYADYIEQIEIESLWSGTKHILWNLDRKVNILSGINGVGKSTILSKVIRGLAQGGEFPSHMLKGVRLRVQPSDAKWIRYDVIRSFDRPMVSSDSLAQMENLKQNLIGSYSYCNGSILTIKLMSETASLRCYSAEEMTQLSKHKASLKGRICFKTSSIIYSKRRGKVSFEVRMRFVLPNWEKCFHLINCQAVRSKC